MCAGAKPALADDSTWVRTKSTGSVLGPVSLIHGQGHRGAVAHRGIHKTQRRRANDEGCGFYCLTPPMTLRRGCNPGWAELAPLGRQAEVAGRICGSMDKRISGSSFAQASPSGKPMADRSEDRLVD